MMMRLDLVTRLDPPRIPPRRQRARWWLARLLVDWAHSLTRREMGPEPVWLQEFASAYLRARRVFKFEGEQQHG